MPLTSFLLQTRTILPLAARPVLYKLNGEVLHVKVGNPACGFSRFNISAVHSSGATARLKPRYALLSNWHNVIGAQRLFRIETSSNGSSQSIT